MLNLPLLYPIFVLLALEGPQSQNFKQEKKCERSINPLPANPTFDHPAQKSLLTLSQTSPGFYVSAVQVFWKHCRKRRNCS